MSDERKQGALLAIPNAIIVATVGLVVLAFARDPLGLVLIALAAGVVLAGATIPAISTRRLRKFASKHGATSFLS